MFNIDHNLRAFISAVRHKRSLTSTSKGVWFIENQIVNGFRRLFGATESGEISLLQAFGNCLERLEAIPVRFIADSSWAASQVVDYQLYIEAGEALLQRTERCSSQQALKERLTLKRALVALHYRLESVNGGLNPSNSPEELFSALVELADDWKFSTPLFHNRTLSQSDLNILRKACQFTEFTEIILEDKNLREAFFIWALRDRISILPFIEYPSLQKKIFASELNGRIGRMGGQLLKIQMVRNSQHPSGIVEKMVTLPFEGREISILDENRVILFRGNYALTVGEVFEIFENKKYKPGNLEFMAEGIINWNDHFWGWWDEDVQGYQMVDLEQDEWWEQLPIHEILTLKQAREKYGNHLDGRQWNFATIATRMTEDLDPENSHAYTSVAIPLGDSRYAIYPFGKYAFTFPRTFLEAVRTLAETVDATVAYPDENVYYTHRQRTRLSFAFSAEQGRTYMASVKRDMIQSRSGNFVYQLEADNCAQWTQGKIEEVLGKSNVPNLFQIAYLDCQPRGFLSVMYAMVKTLPHRWQIPVTTFLHLPFGAYRGKWIWENEKRVWKALTYHSFWQDTIAYLPALLYNQQKSGLLGHSVASGVRFTAALIKESFHGLTGRLEQFGRFVASTVAKRLDVIFSRAKMIARIHLVVQHIDEPNSQEAANTNSEQPYELGTTLAHSKGLSTVEEQMKDWTGGSGTSDLMDTCS